MDKTFKASEIIEKLKAQGYKTCAIIQTPDYSGGHRQGLTFSKDEDEDWWEGLQSFEYIEWRGTVDNLLIEDPWLNDHIEPFHEEPYDYEWEWINDEEIGRICKL